jgi:hypothetical protein
MTVTEDLMTIEIDWDEAIFDQHLTT